MNTSSLVDFESLNINLLALYLYENYDKFITDRKQFENNKLHSYLLYKYPKLSNKLVDSYVYSNLLYFYFYLYNYTLTFRIIFNM